MSRIKVLPTLLINQIAAGECIERPASVVKELVENSLDAGATSIQVDIEDAGNRLIRITDNGCGMDEEDLTLALVPHATSKIYTPEDLWSIRTLGFRGEALASIASVAEIRIASAIEGANVGYQIEARNHQTQPVKAIAMNKGTVIEVKNLFFNIPGRRKFLKNQSTEFSHITHTIVQLAISFPKVSFKLLHNQRQQLSLQATDDPHIRIQELLGVETVKGEYHSQNYELQAYLALPKNFRSNNQWQFCYINHRYVKDRVSLKALQDGYHEYLSNKNYAIGILYLQVAPTLLDVNVHPTKSEIRHRYGQEIYHLVYQTVISTLRKQDLSAFVQFNKEKQHGKNSHILESKKTETLDGEDTISESSELGEFIHSPDYAKIPVFSRPFLPKQTHSFSNEQTIENTPNDRIHELPIAYAPEQIQDTPQPEEIPQQTEMNHPTPLVNLSQSRQSEQDTLASIQPSQIPAEVPIRQEKQAEKEKNVLQHNKQISMPFEETDIHPDRIFQLHNTYLVCGSEEGLILFDQHALHERILYEEFRRNSENQTLMVETLMFPEYVRLSSQEFSIVQSWQTEWKKIGIETQLKESAVEIITVPKILGKYSPQVLFLDILHQVQTLGKMDVTKLTEHALATMACRAAIKAGDILTKQEIMNLIKMRKLAENSFHCPHGRPTTVKISIPELEKYFHRR